MLKRLFLSIVILSTLAYEGGTSYSAELIDYYLLNFTHLDIIQDSTSAISGFDAQELSSLERRGTPVAFFKFISQNLLDSKASNRDNHLESIWMSYAFIVLATFILLFIFLNRQKLFVTRRTLLSLADSSPPAYC